jgi:ribosomal protein S18 acetylase RimI-like enzyme
MPLGIKVLGRHHRALLEGFQNQHQSLVDYLRRFALRHSEKDLLARSGPVAFRLFVTDAIDEAAARFYERFGFSRLGSEFPCRMVLDLKPLLG